MGKITLGEVAIECKTTWKSDKVGVPIVGLEHLEPGEITLSNWEIDSENTFTKKFSKGQVLLGRRRVYLRKAVMAPVDGICSGDITVIEAIPEKILPELLPFVIQNDRFFDYAVQGSAGSLSPRVKWEHLKKYSFELPPIDEQKVLANKLWAAYRLKDSYKKLLFATDEMVKSQFIEMFGTLDNPKGEIESLGSVCNIQRGGSPRPISEYITDQSDGLNWIKIGDTDDSMYITKTEEKIKPSGLRKTREVYAGDLLLSNSMSFGRPYILKIDGCIHDGWLVLHINDAKKLSPVYLCSYLSQQGTYAEMAKLAAGGVVQNLNSNIVKQLDVIVPDMKEQIKYIQILEQADKSKFELCKSIEAIDAVIKSLVNN